MTWLKKKQFWIPLLMVFLVTATFAAIPEKHQSDDVQVGRSSSSADKRMIFDVGDGATNPKLIIDATDKDFTFNKLLNVLGDLFKLGDGTTGGDKIIEFDTGDGGSNKNLTLDATTKILSTNAEALQFGDGTASDQDLIFDKGAGAANPRFRWSETKGKLQFSPDGSTFKAVGSGGGGSGGFNLLQEGNPSFEDGTDQWTNGGGGTFSATSAASEVLFGEQSGKWDAAAGTDVLSSATTNQIKGLEDRMCLARMKYRWPSGVLGDINWQVEVNGALKINLPLEPSDITREAVSLFPCGSQGDSVQTKLLANADAAEIFIDDFHLGENFLGSGQPINILAAARWAGGASKVDTITGSSWQDFNNANFATRTNIGDAVDPADPNDLALKIVGLPAGDYIVTATGRMEAIDGNDNAAGTRCYWGLFDGTDRRGIAHTYQGDRQADVVAGDSIATLQGLFSYGAAGDREFVVQANGVATTGSDLCSIDFANADLGFEITVRSLNATTVQALRLSTMSFRVDANMGGANFDMGAGADTSPVTVLNAGIDLVLNTGSASAFQACDTGEVASALTCSSGDENLGISFQAEIAGAYKVCMEASVGLNGGFTVLELNETNNGDFTILQRGGSRITAQSVTNLEIFPLHLCGTFTFNAAGQKTIRAFFEKDGTSVQLIYADRDASSHDRDIHWTVRRVTQDFPIPIILTESLITPGADNTVEFIQDLDCATASTKGAFLGSTELVNTIGNRSSGDCTFTLNTGLFGLSGRTNDEPWCFTSIPEDNSAAVNVGAVFSSATAGTFHCQLGAGDCASDVTFSVRCIGPKP